LSEPSIDEAKRTVAEALKIIKREYESPFFARRAEKMSSNDFLKAAKGFAEASMKISASRILWLRSFQEGKDAIKEKIDVKLLEEGKLDMDLFGRIIKRSSDGEHILRVLNQIEFYSAEFLQKCQTKERARETIKLIRSIVLRPCIKNMERDLSRMRNQIERCNLYFQNRLNMRMFWLSIGSMSVGFVALLIALLPYLISIFEALSN
jgi:hypothetical protein